MSSPDSRTLRIDVRPGEGDPIAASLVAGAPVGLLGIQLETRRRNRVNGTVVEDGRPRLRCAGRPELRQLPAIHSGAEARPHGRSRQRRARCTRSARSCPTDAAALVQPRRYLLHSRTASPLERTRRSRDAEGVDVSHRGGKPGFVRVTEEHGRTVLTSPDFAGQPALQHIRQPRAQPARWNRFHRTSPRETCCH